MRQGGRVILDAQRFAQVGTWSGTLRIDGEEIAVSDDRWLGTRDRSWGIRPVGEAEPAGRAAAEPAEDFGFWWVYAPLRFDDFALIIIAQETGDGTRTLNEATRVWPAASGRPPEQLGWPGFEIRYRPGTRHPESAVIHLTEPAAGRLTVEIETLGFVALNCGAGYGGDPDWGHGQWRGRGWVESSRPRHERPGGGRSGPLRGGRPCGPGRLRRIRRMGDVRARDLRPPRPVGLRRLRVGGTVTPVG
jgi:hypothetical protein